VLDVVCFGEILWDVLETSARGREPIARTFRRELGGAPANVATGLARLGVRSALVGGVGRDRLGDALLGHLRADRVDVRFV
jgi:fructokinase